ncbi:MAG: carboxypeptidase-like regulatory domain-containing protein [Luteolibacter sp.]
MKNNKNKRFGIFVCFIVVLICLLATYGKKHFVSNKIQDDLKRSIPTANQITVKNADPLSRLLNAYQTPIEFYGKIIDQFGDPVAGASIKVFPMDNPTEKSKTELILNSDAEGKFSIKGIKGLAIGVECEKQGYFTISDLGLGKPASSRRIEYGLSDVDGSQFKNPNKPTIFNLHKIGSVEPMFHLEEDRWRLSLDGTPVKIALDSKKGTGPHQIEFRLISDFRNLPDVNESNSKSYDWKFEATIRGGGFCIWPSEYQFEAPEDGYQEHIEINFPAVMPDGEKWVRSGHRRLFAKFPDGTYARIRMTIESNSNYRPLLMEAWMNLKPGSRNLNFPTRDGSVINY